MVSMAGNGVEAAEPAATTDDALARALIRARQERGTLSMARASLIICVVAAPFIAYVAIAVNRDLGLALGGIAVGFAAYQGFMLWLIGRGLYRPWIDWLNATFEITLATGVIATDAALQGPAYAYSSSPAYLLPITVLFSAVRLRRSLSLYTGALAAVLYLALYLVVRDGIEPELLAALPSLETWNIVQRSCFFMFAGFVAYLLCALMRRSVIELVASVRQTLLVERTLGRHVSREVADVLVGAGGESPGEERDISVLFVDIRAFTTFSEASDPARVVELLNDYFTVAGRAVEAHGGIVNKFTGDGLMALFGAPAAHDDHARRAVAAALDTLDGLDELARWGPNRPRVGIGVHSGRAVVGTVGTDTRAEYTAIGDAVNLAARIEQLTKQFGADLLVSGATAAQLGDEVALDRVDEVAVRGRREPIEVFRVARSANRPDQ